MNGVKKHITTPRYTRREPKGDMTRESRRTLPLRDKVLLLILGLNYSGTENFKANGKDHSR
jgi:hypothetical protein